MHSLHPATPEATGHILNEIDLQTVLLIERAPGYYLHKQGAAFSPELASIKLKDAEGARSLSVLLDDRDFWLRTLNRLYQRDALIRKNRILLTREDIMAATKSAVPDGGDAGAAVTTTAGDILTAMMMSAGLLLPPQEISYQEYRDHLFPTMDDLLCEAERAEIELALGRITTSFSLAKDSSTAVVADNIARSMRPAAMALRHIGQHRIEVEHALLALRAHVLSVGAEQEHVMAAIRSDLTLAELSQDLTLLKLALGMFEPLPVFELLQLRESIGRFATLVRTSKKLKRLALAEVVSKFTHLDIVDIRGQRRGAILAPRIHTASQSLAVDYMPRTGNLYLAQQLPLQSERLAPLFAPTQPLLNLDHALDATVSLLSTHVERIAEPTVMLVGENLLAEVAGQTSADDMLQLYVAARVRRIVLTTAVAMKEQSQSQLASNAQISWALTVDHKVYTPVAADLNGYAITNDLADILLSMSAAGVGSSAWDILDILPSSPEGILVQMPMMAITKGVLKFSNAIGRRLVMNQSIQGVVVSADTSLSEILRWPVGAEVDLLATPAASRLASEVVRTLLAATSAMADLSGETDAGLARRLVGPMLHGYYSTAINAAAYTAVKATMIQKIVQAFGEADPKQSRFELAQRFRAPELDIKWRIWFMHSMAKVTGLLNDDEVNALENLIADSEFINMMLMVKH